MVFGMATRRGLLALVSALVTVACGGQFEVNGKLITIEPGCEDRGEPGGIDFEVPRPQRLVLKIDERREITLTVGKPRYRLRPGPGCPDLFLHRDSFSRLTWRWAPSAVELRFLESPPGSTEPPADGLRGIREVTNPMIGRYRVEIVGREASVSYVTVYGYVAPCRTEPGEVVECPPVWEPTETTLWVTVVP